MLSRCSATARGAGSKGASTEIPTARTATTKTALIIAGGLLSLAVAGCSGDDAPLSEGPPTALSSLASEVATASVDSAGVLTETAAPGSASPETSPETSPSGNDPVRVTAAMVNTFFRVCVRNLRDAAAVPSAFLSLGFTRVDGADGQYEFGPLQGGLARVPDAGAVVCYLAADRLDRDTLIQAVEISLDRQLPDSHRDNPATDRPSWIIGAPTAGPLAVVDIAQEDQDVAAGETSMISVLRIAAPFGVAGLE